MRKPTIRLSEDAVAVLRELAREPCTLTRLKRHPPRTETGKEVRGSTITTWVAGTKNWSKGLKRRSLVDRGYLYEPIQRGDTLYVTPKAVQLLLILVGSYKSLGLSKKSIHHAGVKSGYRDTKEGMERFKFSLLVGRACKVFRFLDVYGVVPLGSRVARPHLVSLDVGAEWVVSAGIREIEERIQAVSKRKTSLARIHEDFMHMFEGMTWDEEFQSSHLWAMLWGFMKRWFSLVDQPFTTLQELGLSLEQINLLVSELGKRGFFEELRLRELAGSLGQKPVRQRDGPGRTPLQRHIPTITASG